MLTPLSQTLLLVGLVSAVPLSAMALMARGNATANWYARLVPLAAGSLFSAAAVHLLPEAISRLGDPLLAWALVLGGLLLFWRLDHLLHGTPSRVLVGSTAPSANIGPVGRGLVGTAMIGDGIHNMVDGMLIATALLDGPTMGVVAALAISVHEMPRELGTFGILIRGGLSTGHALLFNAMTAALALGAATAVHYAGDRVVSSVIWLLPVAAGNFIYLAGSLALSEYRSSVVTRDGWLRFALFTIGAAVAALGALWHP